MDGTLKRISIPERFGEYLLRLARIEDAEAVYWQRIKVATHCDTVLSKPEEITQKGIESWIRDWLGRDNRLFLVVEYEGDIVGQLWVWFIDSKLRLSHVAEFGLEVAPEHQGKGLGKKLVDVAIEWAFEKGARRLQAETLLKNRPMVHILRKKGFIVEGVRHRYVNVNGNLEDTLCFAKLFQEG